MLILTPARNKWTAVVCRIVCGLTCFVASDGTFMVASSAYWLTSLWIPNRVNGWLTLFKKTASVLGRPAINVVSDVVVIAQSGQVQNLFRRHLEIALG